MGLTLLLDGPFYEGTPVSDEVPGRYPVALGGHAYLIDTANNDWRHESIPLLRQQADDSSAPSDRSLNPESLWRRSITDWQGGAGQKFRDRDGSSPTRFRASYNIDVWTEGEISLLPATEEWEDSSDTNLRLAPAGSRLYFCEGQATKYVTSLSSPSPTTVTSTHASAVTALVSTGYWVLIGCSDGIYRTNTGTNAAAKWSALVPEALDFCKGRVMASAGAAIYNVTDDIGGGGVPYAAPSALYTHPDSNFTWVGFCGGPTTQHIYAAGYSGDKSVIYKVPLKDDGTGLDAPIVAGELPDGEIVRSIYSYLGFLFIGTDNGVRFATSGSGGDLNIGALLETGDAVRCFEGQGPHVWFGWDDFTPDLALTTLGPYGGLGRLSLEEFASTDNLAPAYASDILSNASGDVLDVCTFADQRVFAVSGAGFYTEDTSGTLAGFGEFRSGWIDYGLVEDKVALYLSVHHRSTDGGSHRAAIAVDETTPVELATVTTSNEKFLCGEARGKSFEFTVALLRDATDDTVGPTVEAVVLESEPTTATAEYLFAPLLLHETLDVDGGQVGCNPALERAYVRDLRDSRRLVVWQEASERSSVVVSDFVWQPHQFTPGNTDVDGTLVVKLKKVA